jgi:hypothetical protein
LLKFSKRFGKLFSLTGFDIKKKTKKKYKREKENKNNYLIIFFVFLSVIIKLCFFFSKEITTISLVFITQFECIIFHFLVINLVLIFSSWTFIFICLLCIFIFIYFCNYTKIN